MTKIFPGLVTAALASVLCACVELRSVDEKKDAPVTVTALAAPVVLRTGEWNEFRVHVPAHLTGLPLRKSKMNADRKTFGAPFWVPAIVGQTFVDTDVVPGEVYLYEWGRFKNEVFEGAGRARLAIPLDLEVTKDVVDGGGEDARRLFSTEVFGRLIFREVIVETSGRAWIPRADSISFERTVIRSFAPGARAAEGSSGRSGGRIHFVASAMGGDVHFEMRGEDGGDGKPGRAPDTALKGATGRNGRPPVVQDMGSCGPFNCRTVKCVEQAMDGEPGYPGRRGYDGEPGGNGGDSGEILLDAGDRHALRITSEFLPGRAGRGGSGGLGGEGGNGGAAGVYTGNLLEPVQLVSCVARIAGPRGSEGSRGFEGAPGRPGLRQEFCVMDSGRLSCN